MSEDETADRWGERVPDPDLPAIHRPRPVWLQDRSAVAVRWLRISGSLQVALFSWSVFTGFPVSSAVAALGVLLAAMQLYGARLIARSHDWGYWVAWLGLLGLALMVFPAVASGSVVWVPAAVFISIQVLLVLRAWPNDERPWTSRNDGNDSGGGDWSWGDDDGGDGGDGGGGSDD